MPEANRQMEELDASLANMAALMLDGSDASGVDFEGAFEDLSGPGAHAPAISSPESASETAGERVSGEQGAAEAVEEPSVPALPDGADVKVGATTPVEDPDSAGESASVDEVMHGVAAAIEAGSSARGEKEPEAPEEAREGASRAAAGVVPPARETQVEPSPVREAPAAAIAPAAEAPGAVPAKDGAGAKLRAKAGSIASQAGTKASSAGASLAARALEPIAGILSSKPASVRHAAAWLAVWTLFNGSCVWAWVLVFRDRGTPEPSAGMVYIAGSGHEPPPEVLERAKRKQEEARAKAAAAAAHGESEEGGGHGAGKDSGHGAPKKDAHGTAKDSGHGAAKAASHGSSSKSAKKPAKDSHGAPAKKSGGH